MELRPIHEGKRFALILKVVICVVRGQLDDQYAVLVGESGEVPVRDLLGALIGLKEPFGIEAPSRAEPLERRKNDFLVRLRAFRDVVADEVQNNSTPDWTVRIAKAACPAARWMLRSRASRLISAPAVSTPAPCPCRGPGAAPRPSARAGRARRCRRAGRRRRASP